MSYEQNYLAHFGIKGQKWGLRRFQNEDGTLTEEGMRRYGIAGRDGHLSISDRLKARYRNERSRDSLYAKQIREEKQSGKKIPERRKVLENNFLEKGLTKSQAEIEALKRYNTEKVIKVAGAIAVTAAVAYGAYKGHQWLSRYGDRTLKKGSEVYRVMSGPTENPGQAAFATNNVKDAIKYRGMYGGHILDNQQSGAIPNNGVWQFRGKAGSKIKIAGERNGAKVYEHLMKTDPEFVRENAKVMREWNKLPINDWNKHTPYQKFNTALVDHQTEGTKVVQEKFFNALKAKGYGGVVDLNDKVFSGYDTKNPFILADFSNKITNKTVKQITPMQIAESYDKARGILLRDGLRKQTVSQAMKSVRNYGLLSGFLFGGGVAANKANLKRAQNSSARYKTVIKEYKREHPNTKLTDKQILESVLG